MLSVVPSYGYETVLHRAGFELVAGADEAGRGACAGPLVAGAVILRPGTEIAGLADSKALSASRRERLYDEITQRALAWAVAVVGPGECDRLGMQRADLEGLRRALLRLELTPDFSLTDGFAVDGLVFPNLGVWKGDQVVACIAAASIVAKVTRDRIMAELHEQYPAYGFDGHKGYCTAEHQRRLAEFGPCPAHRRCFGNVRAAGQTGVM